MCLKNLYLLVALAILIGAVLAIHETNLVYASGTIYILASGDISPPTANISSTDHQTYVFTGNVNDSIVIQRSNIILDGSGYSLMAPMSEQAIYVYQQTNVTIANMTIQQSKTGILFKDCSLCSITGNEITNNTGCAIELVTSSNSSVVENYVDDNSNLGVLLNGSSGSTVDNNILMDNYGGIEMTNNATRNTINDNYIHGSGVGVDLEWYSTQNIILENNIVGNSGDGIAIGTMSSNNTVEGNSLKDNTNTGLTITQAPNCTIIDNNVIGNYYGISLMYVNTTQLQNNQIYDNRYNFALYFNESSDLLNDVDATNTVNFKPIYYWVNKHGLTIPTDAGIVILHDCTDILVQSIDFTDTVWQAIMIGYSDNITVTDCRVESASNQTEYCIQLRNATNCMLDRNYLHGSIGIELDYSSNNTIYNNTLTGGSNSGAIRLQLSENNVIYHNNFINNSANVFPDETSSNLWDNGYPDGGNYWDNYADRVSNPTDTFSGPNQDQAGPDGFWDLPYPISDSNIDHYPIVPEYSTVILFVSLISVAAAVIAFRRKNYAWFS